MLFLIRVRNTGDCKVLFSPLRFCSIGFCGVNIKKPGKIKTSKENAVFLKKVILFTMNEFLLGKQEIVKKIYCN